MGLKWDHKIYIKNIWMNELHEQFGDPNNLSTQVLRDDAQEIVNRITDFLDIDKTLDVETSLLWEEVAFDFSELTSHPDINHIMFDFLLDNLYDVADQTRTWVN